jgi:hypothetical protein
MCSARLETVFRPAGIGMVTRHPPYLTPTSILTSLNRPCWKQHWLFLIVYISCVATHLCYHIPHNFNFAISYMAWGSTAINTSRYHSCHALDIYVGAALSLAMDLPAPISRDSGIICLYALLHYIRRLRYYTFFSRFTTPAVFRFTMIHFPRFSSSTNVKNARSQWRFLLYRSCGGYKE